MVARAGIEPATFRFQTDLCSDGTCLRWSNWTNARHTDVLDQLVRLVGPILAP